MAPEKEFLLFGITPARWSPVQQGLVNELFRAGLDYLYIRSEETDINAWHQLLERIDSPHYPRLLLPANAPVAAAGRHYIRHIRESERVAGMGQEDHHQPRSTSMHDLSVVPQLAGLYAYVFYSPLFPSISKPGYQPQVDLPLVTRQLADLQQQGPALPAIIGLGGVDAANISRVKAAGFQGAALLGALWQSDSPLKALAAIRNELV